MTLGASGDFDATYPPPAGAVHEAALQPAQRFRARAAKARPAAGRANAVPIVRATCEMLRGARPL